MEWCFVRLNDGWNRLVRHRQDARFDAKRNPDGIGRFGERLPFSEQGRPVDVRRQIAVAQVEPCLAAEDAQPLQRMKCLAAKSPAFRGVDDPREGVGDDVQIGGDF